MREDPPCIGCQDRHSCCHDSCDKYKEWLDRHHAQQKHLKENRNRWCTPLTEAREKAYSHPNNRKFLKGGNYE